MASEEIKYADKRANEILEVVMAYARLDFKQKISITNKEDVFDSIGTGVNMLGEELEGSTISLREKEQLLKEVHHRVKNNLQIISSLLNLQSDNFQDERFLAMIRESKNRINSMALIHEMLYIAKDFSQINMSDYIVKLSQSVYQSFNAKDSSIAFEYDIDESLFLEIDRMIPIGLILNEIISNSLKYAFPAKKGTIKFCLKEKKGNICFTISDDGIGIPKDFDYSQTKSLGVQLIPMLCDQIDAGLTINSERGTCYDLCFKALMLS